MSANESVVNWTRAHPGLMLIPAFSAIGAMLAVYVKRHSSPANVILLGVFTLLEAITLGSAISYVNSAIVLQAFAITTFVFLGLTLFTLQVAPPCFEVRPDQQGLRNSPTCRANTTLLRWGLTSTLSCSSSSSRACSASSCRTTASSTRSWPGSVAACSAPTSSLIRASVPLAAASHRPLTQQGFLRHLLFSKLHVDDWVVACVSLYLEYVHPAKIQPAQA